MALLILDFDGVVLESVEVKTQAFLSLFPAEKAGEVLASHQATPGLGRAAKIAGMFAAIHGRAPDEREIRQLLDQFAARSRDGIMNCPEVPGVRDFLAALAGIPVHVVSAAPEEEVKSVAEERNLAQFFQSISGQPVRKEVHLARLLAGNPGCSALFIGDRTSDLEAALASGIRFLGRVAGGDENPFPPEIPVIADFISGGLKVREMLAA